MSVDKVLQMLHERLMVLETRPSLEDPEDDDDDEDEDDD